MSLRGFKEAWSGLIGVVNIWVEADTRCGLLIPWILLTSFIIRLHPKHRSIEKLTASHQVHLPTTHKVRSWRWFIDNSIDTTIINVTDLLGKKVHHLKGFQKDAFLSASRSLLWELHYILIVVSNMKSRLQSLHLRVCMLLKGTERKWKSAKMSSCELQHPVVMKYISNSTTLQYHCCLMTECLLFIGLLHFIFLIVPNKVCKPVFKVSY